MLELIALFNRPGLSRRLLLYILLCSSFFTLLSTGFQLYTDYERDLSDIHRQIDFIRDSCIEPLAVHACNMDYHQMNLLLAGVFNLKDIVNLEIIERTDNTPKSITMMGSPPEKNTIFHELTLMYPSCPKDAAQHATLLVGASLSGVYQGLWDKTLVILISNAVKTFIAAFCIFLVIQHVVTQHLVRLVMYTKGLHVDRPVHPLALKEKKNRLFRKDELDQLVDAINDMWSRVIRTGDTLRKSQALLNDLQQMAKIGGWEYDVTSDRLVWTDETYRMHGVSKDTYDPGDPFRNLQFYEQKDQKILEEAFREAVTRGQPYDLELGFCSPDGCRLRVRTSGQAEFKDTAVVRVYGSIMDITEMRQTETQYRLLAENVIDVIWTMDLDLRFLYLSPSVERLIGYTEEEITAGSLENYVTQTSFEKAMTVYKEGLFLEKEKGKGFLKKNRALELEHVHKNGTIVWSETRLSVIRDPDGNLSGIIGVTRDITRRRQAETRLHQAQKLEAIGSLAGGIVHDFNNILSAIIGYSQLAMDRLPADSPGQRPGDADSCLQPAAEAECRPHSYQPHHHGSAQISQINPAKFHWHPAGDHAGCGKCSG